MYYKAITTQGEEMIAKSNIYAAAYSEVMSHIKHKMTKKEKADVEKRLIEHTQTVYIALLKTTHGVDIVK